MKTIIRYCIIFLAVAALRSDAREKYWIYFADKGTQPQAVAAKSYSASDGERLLGITPRALARRAQRAASRPSQAIAIDALDLSVAREYTGVLRTQGITPVTESRWLNAVSAYLTDEQYRVAAALPFVAAIERVRVHRPDSLAARSEQVHALPKTSSPSVSRLEYGTSLEQLQQINVPKVHDLYITGRGVLVGMLDDGFRWRTHEALKNIHVLAEYDFIQKDSVTSNQAGDSADEDEHGTMTLSTLAGYMPGSLIGPAFGASFMLGKTEYSPAELNIEEDNWVAGLEWLERNGVDIVSTSLGYSEFDPGQHSYTYQDMNGHTAVTTKAAAVAARKGVLICVAMGNEGAQSWHYLTSPADADSIISVGAVSPGGFVTSFSSVGPTSDGRMKPEVCARGQSVFVATPITSGASTYASVNGTSVATPLVAGVAALVLSARPELTPMQLRDALRLTASNAAAPNNSIGWGIVDAYKALLYHGFFVSPLLDVVTNADGSRTITTAVLSPTPLNANQLVVYTSLDGGVRYAPASMHSALVADAATNSGTYSFVLPAAATHFFISAMDNGGAIRSLPSTAPKIVYNASLNQVASPVEKPVIDPWMPPESFALVQNFPNPFNGQTTIRYELARASHVSLTVYDVLGRVAAVLVNNDEAAGYHAATWDASAAASGIYFYSLRTGEFSETKKMILIR